MELKHLEVFRMIKNECFVMVGCTPSRSLNGVIEVDVFSSQYLSLQPVHSSPTVELPGIISDEMGSILSFKTRRAKARLIMCNWLKAERQVITQD